MNKVDINYKIRNCKAKTHFYIHSGILVVLALTYLLAFIDYANLPRDASSNVRRAVFSYFIFYIPIHVVIACAYLLLLLCPNQIWYGICMAFVATYTCYRLFVTTLPLIAYGMTRTIDKEERNVLNFYNCGILAKVFLDYGGVICGIYLCWILFELSFLYTPKQSAELYVVRVTSPSAEQATDIAIDTHGNSYITRAPISPEPATEEDSDSDSDSGEEGNDQKEGFLVEQAKSKSNKSRKSQKSGKSRKSHRSKKSQKSRKSRKPQKKKYNSTKATKTIKSMEPPSKSSKSEENVAEDLVKPDNPISFVAL